MRNVGGNWGAIGCCAEVEGGVHGVYQINEEEEGGLLLPTFLLFQDSSGFGSFASHDELEGDGDGGFQNSRVGACGGASYGGKEAGTGATFEGVGVGFDLGDSFEDEFEDKRLPVGFCEGALVWSTGVGAFAGGGGGDGCGLGVCLLFFLVAVTATFCCYCCFFFDFLTPVFAAAALSPSRFSPPYDILIIRI